MYGHVNEYITKQSKYVVLTYLQRYQFLKKINNIKQNKIIMTIQNNNIK